MDINAELQKANAAYTHALEEMEAARTNPHRLSGDPAKKEAADQSYREARTVAGHAYERVNDLERLAQSQQRRELARQRLREQKA